MATTYDRAKCERLKSSWNYLKNAYKQERDSGNPKAKDTFKKYKQLYREWLNNCPDGGARKSRRKTRKLHKRIRKSRCGGSRSRKGTRKTLRRRRKSYRGGSVSKKYLPKPGENINEYIDRAQKFNPPIMPHESIPIFNSGRTNHLTSTDYSSLPSPPPISYSSLPSPPTTSVATSVASLGARIARLSAPPTATTGAIAADRLRERLARLRPR